MRCRCLLPLLVLAIAARPTATRASSGSPPLLAQFDIALMSVRVNGIDSGPAVRVLRRGDEVLLRAVDLERWQIDYPPAGVERIDGQSFVSLDTLESLSYRIENHRQELVVTAAPSAFELSQISGRKTGSTTPQPSSPGGFLNYDLTLNTHAGDQQVAGAFELSFAHHGWSAQTTFINGVSGLARLETGWTRDLPDRLASWRIGDAVTFTGAIGRPVRFAGIQRATDLSVRPGFVTFPLPTLSGEAAVPSVVELYVDGALRLHQRAGVGPFEILDPPLLDGAGTVDLVIRDLQGRERVVSQSLYVSSDLLAVGIKETAFQAGLVREGFGSGRDGYGRLLLSGTYRRGLSDRLTGEVHAELVEGQHMLGLGSTLLAGRLGVVSLDAAWSGSSTGSGAHGSLRFVRRSRRLSASGEISFTSRDFTQLGQPATASRPRLQKRLQVGTSARRLGSLTVGYFERESQEGPRIEIASATFSRKITDHLFLSTNFQSSMMGDRERRWSCSLTRFLGSRHSAGGKVRSESGVLRTGIHLQRHLSRGPGYGFSLATDNGQATRRVDATATLQGRYGRYRLALGRANGQSAARLTATGALALVDGNLVAARRIDRSFALVRLADFPGVRVYHDNRLAARTDRRGFALLPDLRPYQENPIRIESDDLPLAARVDRLEIRAVPYDRGGLAITFPIKAEQAALLRLVQASGEPVPAGATASAGHDATETTVVGYGGEIYLTGLKRRGRVRVSWPGSVCEAQYDLAATEETLPVLGPLLCLDQGDPAQ